MSFYFYPVLNCRSAYERFQCGPFSTKTIRYEVELIAFAHGRHIQSVIALFYSPLCSFHRVDQLYCQSEVVSEQFL